MQTEVIFLGHIVGRTGLACDTAKLSAVLNWHAPDKVKAVWPYVVSSCVLYPLCVLYVSKNVRNNIKREENMNKNVLPKYPNPLIIYFILPIYILQFEFVKYKTHKGYRTHELICVVSSCVLYPLCVLYFLAKYVGNNIKREETYSHEACM